MVGIIGVKKEEASGELFIQWLRALCNLNDFVFLLTINWLKYWLMLVE